MIVKDRNASEHSNGKGSSTPEVELATARHLRRAFARGAAVLVLNDLRLPLPDDSGGHAQVDHVVIHRYGLIVIESATGHSAAPVAKVRGLVDLMRRILTEQFDPLGVGRLAGLPIDGLVAVADPSGSTGADTCRPDAVPARVEALVEGYRAAPKRFDGHARQQVADHLVGAHAPRRAHGQSASWVAPSPNASHVKRRSRGRTSV